MIIANLATQLDQRSFHSFGWNEDYERISKYFLLANAASFTCQDARPISEVSP
jgi:hypothetical protein